MPTFTPPGKPPSPPFLLRHGGKRGGELLWGMGAPHPKSSKPLEVPHRVLPSRRRLAGPCGTCRLRCALGDKGAAGALALTGVLV